MASVTVTAEEWHDKGAELAGEGWLALDLCGLDRMNLPGNGERFEVVVQLLHQERKERRTLRVAATGDPPTVPSLIDIYPTVDFMEREAFDMFGIHFEGHPNLTRIFMPDEWEGYPLRKDYGVGKVPVDFIPQPFLQIEAPGQAPNSAAADRPVDELGQAEATKADQATPGARP